MGLDTGTNCIFPVHMRDRPVARDYSHGSGRHKWIQTLAFCRFGVAETRRLVNRTKTEAASTPATAVVEWA